MTDRILLSEIQVSGRHGVLPEEHEKPQPFSVDVEIETNIEEAAQTDGLDDTFDYRLAIEAVTNVVEKESHALLERMASRIATQILETDKAEAVTVTVRKVEPLMSQPLAFTAVTIRRER